MDFLIFKLILQLMILGLLNQMKHAFDYILSIFYLHIAVLPMVVSKQLSIYIKNNFVDEKNIGEKSVHSVYIVRIL
jgi:hypothetical protein